MIEPGGRICGFDSSLGIYLRSSPLVCAFDALTIAIRFLVYLVQGHGPPTAAKMVKLARGTDVENAQEGRSWSLENRLPVALLYFGLAIGVVTQVIKLTACSGILWTKAACWSYFAYFLIVEAMNKLAEKAATERDAATTNPSDRTEFNNQNQRSVTARLNAEEPESTMDELDLGERGSFGLEAQRRTEGNSTRNYHDPGAQIVAGDDLAPQKERKVWNLCERCWGTLAVLLQLVLLALVDLAAQPPDTDLKLRWTFRCVRLCAHFFVILIYLPLRMMLRPEELRPRHLAYLILSFVVILSVAANTHDYRFSQMYFMYSHIISSLAWLLYFIDSTKRNVLFSKTGDRSILNVLAFDFCGRTFGFSLFWYMKIYDPKGTFKPPWAEYIG